MYSKMKITLMAFALFFGLTFTSCKKDEIIEPDTTEIETETENEDESDDTTDDPIDEINQGDNGFGDNEISPEN